MYDIVCCVMRLDILLLKPSAITLKHFDDLLLQGPTRRCTLNYTSAPLDPILGQALVDAAIIERHKNNHDNVMPAKVVLL